MDEVKPVAWAFAQDWTKFQADRRECRLLPNFYWGEDLSLSSDYAALYDQQAIDTLRAEVERLRMFERDSERYLLITHAEAKEWEDAEARAERAEAEAESLLKTLRVAVLALARASEDDADYDHAYATVSSAIEAAKQPKP